LAFAPPKPALRQKTIITLLRMTYTAFDPTERALLKVFPSIRRML